MICCWKIRLDSELPSLSAITDSEQTPDLYFPTTLIKLVVPGGQLRTLYRQQYQIEVTILPIANLSSSVAEWKTWKIFPKICPVFCSGFSVDFLESTFHWSAVFASSLRGV